VSPPRDALAAQLSSYFNDPCVYFPVFQFPKDGYFYSYPRQARSHLDQQLPPAHSVGSHYLSGIVGSARELHSHCYLPIYSLWMPKSITMISWRKITFLKIKL
jgi:hypothetical protein